MRITTLLLLLVGLLLTQVGCSVQGQITDLTQLLISSKPSEGVGLISGGATKQVNGYQVSTALGSYHGSGAAGSNMSHEIGGYKVFTSLQGQLGSDTSVTVVQ
ncbi:MAG: hypothetical protein LW875_04890 [Proteobacteria bacterium]|jgi:hypothetical protein|nr:hypothetical protein [Pseudomonadota bacterium]